jgi:steroid delta-isomerase
MPTTEQKLAAVHGYVAAFEKGDADAVVALFAADATVEDPLGTPIKRGHAEIREFYATSMATGAKLELDGAPRCAADTVAFAFAVKLDWGGQKTVIDVIDTFRLNEDGKIVEMRAYWGPENMKAG